MCEYLSREAVFQVIHGIARGIADRDIEALKAKDIKAFYKAKGAKEILDSVDTDLCYVPVADVQLVKRGEWDFQGYQLFKCTNCKEIFTQNQLEAMQNHIDQEEFAFPNFCPHCGARMKED